MIIRWMQMKCHNCRLNSHLFDCEAYTVSSMRREMKQRFGWSRGRRGKKISGPIDLCRKCTVLEDRTKRLERR